MSDYLLLYILFAPFAGAVALIFASNRQPMLVRSIAASSAGISLLASLYLFYAYDPVKGGFQFIQKFEWSRQLGIALHLGVDGIGTPLVLASSILLFAGIFVSWHIKDRTKEFYIWLLILAAATIGVFMSLDLFFLYFFYEMSVIPMYLLLGMWGSHTKKYLEMTDQEGLRLRDSVGFIYNFGANSKEYAAMKLVLFLSAWAVVALMGILLIYRYSGLNTFDILQLREHAKLNIPVLGTTLDKIIWVLIFFGFASIAPLWPLHSWSPVGHAAAPAATSMLHAGVLMKLGHFSIIRVAFEILPDTTRELMPIAAVLCIFSIIYGGFVAFYAKDTKYVIGYSSSSHMGYVFLGMAALNYIGLSGAVIYMFAHAMATGMLFAMAGWVYDQTHTRDIPSLGGLSNRMPFIAGCFVIACMASVGMPGTVNFIAVIGIVITLAYLFKMMRGLFYGPMDQKYSHSHDAVAVVDRLPLLIMIVVSIGFGLFPMHMYNVVRSGVDPLVAKITLVVPVADARDEHAVPQERPSSVTTSPVTTSASPLVATKPGKATPQPVTGMP
ncbi:MAG: nuoM [Nitrospira sp.]|nr:nuoM [Nitrospira sp.]